MDIRLISVKEDFEKAYKIIDYNYPLSFYEFVLKHDRFSESYSPKLVGVFEDEKCLGHISYLVTHCPHLERILEIKEIHETSIRGHKALMDFIDTLAKEENCRAIKISKKKIERLNFTIFDKFENFLKAINLFH